VRLAVDWRAGRIGLPARRALTVAAVIVMTILALATAAAARPGGGESYSGGGGHGGGSSSDSGAMFELIYWLLWLLIEAPAIGVPVVAIAIGYFAYRAYQQHRNKDWDSGPPIALRQAAPAIELRTLDPAFSQVGFEDFAFRLFSTAHRARHTAEALATVAPYVSEAARTVLAQRPPVGDPVLQVVVGAMRTYLAEIPDTAVDRAGRPRRVRIGIEYEANVATASHTYYIVENWRFGRSATARSKPPGVVRSLPCPSCGAPWLATQSGTQRCASCGEVVDNGRFDWVVELIAPISSDERPPTLTQEVRERGTDLRTYRDDRVDAAWHELTDDDPQLNEPALDARLAMIYGRLNAAWSTNDLRPVRGLVTDGLYDYLQYWVEAYQRQGLRNVLADMRIERSERAKLTRDRYFDALTIRIWATGKDYVIREPGGERVRGSPHRDRRYSEYWTLIRSARRKGAPVATPACSHCGAPLQVAASGACEHCGVHLTGGELDWVVSKIEQDDSYRG
jgi:hypothetical protein